MSAIRYRLRVTEAERLLLTTTARSANMTRQEYVTRRTFGLPDVGAPRFIAGALTRRSVEVDLLWSEVEWQAIKAAAHRAGMETGTYLRARIWGRPEPPATIAGEDRTLRRTHGVRAAKIPARTVRPDDSLRAAIAERLEAGRVSVARLADDLGVTEDAIQPIYDELVG